MRKPLTYIFVVYLSLFIAMAGSGFNLAYFCCTDCMAHGMSHLLRGDCETIHHHHHQHDATCRHHGNCHLLYYDVDEVVTPDTHLTVAPVQITTEWQFEPYQMATASAPSITRLLHSPPSLFSFAEEILSKDCVRRL